MKNLYRLMTVGAVMLTFVQSALAAPYRTEIRGRAVIEEASPGSIQKVIRITGPDQLSYILKAPPSDVEQIAALVQTQPELFIAFNGEVVEHNGQRILQLDTWRKLDDATIQGGIDSAPSDESTTRIEVVK